MTACERGGCTASVEGPHRFCSRRCSALFRLCAGWKPHLALLRPEVRAVACTRGALAAAKVARRRRAKAVTAKVATLLTSRVLSDLDGEQRAAVTALIAKGFRLGEKVGYQRGWHAKDTPRLKRDRQKGAAA